MTKKVVRYSACGNWDGHAEFIEDERGKWVRYSDYQTLRDRLWEHEDHCKRLREALEGYECTCELEATEGWVETVMTCPRCAALKETTDD